MNNNAKLPTVTEIRKMDVGGLANVQNKLKATLQQLEEQRKSIESAISAKVQELPKSFGVNNLDEVVNLITTFANGTVNKIGNSLRVRKPRTVLSHADKVEITRKLVSGSAPIKLAKEYNVSLSTIQKIKEDAGMVNRRGARLAHA